MEGGDRKASGVPSDPSLSSDRKREMVKSMEAEEDSVTRSGTKWRKGGRSRTVETGVCLSDPFLQVGVVKII